MVVASFKPLRGRTIGKSRAVLFWASLAAIALAVQAGQATEVGGDLPLGLSADELVEEALLRESYGLDGERDVLLKKALERRPRNKLALWHRSSDSRHDVVVALYFAACILYERFFS